MLVQSESKEFLNTLTHTLEQDPLVNLAQFTALVFSEFENLNWVGFYLHRNQQLVLGPFQGNAACNPIQIGKGVCGTAALQRKTIIVDNVHEFPGHIVCDSNSKSEMVIPLIYQNHLLGVLDLDSPILARFDQQIQLQLEQACAILIEKTDWKTAIQFI